MSRDHASPHDTAATAVAVAESDFLMRTGITSAIALRRELRLVGCADGLAALFHLLARERIDVVVVGPRLLKATRNGRTLHGRIGGQPRAVGLVMLGEQNPELVLDFVNHGQGGLAYLFEDSIASAERLAHVVLEAAAGNVVLEPEAFELLSGGARANAGVAALTPREHEVLALMASAANNGCIASRLVLTQRAVERHINSIYRKLGLHDAADQHARVAAVLMFRDHWRHSENEEAEPSGPIASAA